MVFSSMAPPTELTTTLGKSTPAQPIVLTSHGPIPLFFSLWIAGENGPIGSTIENRSLSGALISSFAISPGYSALALDPADGTLWLTDTTGPSPTLDLEQYSRDGAFLSSLSLSSLLVPNTSSAYTVHGGEFAFTGTVVPEPSTAIFGAIGFAALFRRRTRNDRNG